MAGEPRENPSEEELVAFAGEVLGDSNQSFAEPELLRETVRQARELWLLLYRIHQAPDDSRL